MEVFELQTCREWLAKLCAAHKHPSILDKHLSKEEIICKNANSRRDFEEFMDI